ncbi:11808_t:CDS:2 [Funneliformis geosporum]|nr:11808_t:CDS:2 [Funneliformis geosporum]
MLWWIENVWYNREGTNNNPRSLLIFDSFRDHLVNSVKNRLDKKQINIAVIPEGLTGRLQPLDVRINKIFKSKATGRRLNEEEIAMYLPLQVKKTAFLRPGFSLSECIS